MRLWAWLAAPAARKNVLQTLVLLVLAANVAVSRPFQEFWRRLRAEDTVHMSSMTEGGGANVHRTHPHLTHPHHNTPVRQKLPPSEICGSCNTSCLHRAVPAYSDILVSDPAPLLPLDEIFITPEVEQLLNEPIVNPHNYGYIHNPSDLCNDDGVEIIFFIASAPEDMYRRREIRLDKLGLFKSIDMFRSVEAVFVMGLPRPGDFLSSITQSLIDKEAKKYRDIIQLNFTDSPANAALKAVSILRWAPSYCSELRYVIHTGDDVILEMKIIYALRYIGKRHDNFVLGRVERRLPVASFPGLNDTFPQEFLPPFAHRGLIGYPALTARLLYEASLRVPPVSRYDVYVTGMCAPRVGAELLEDRRFRFDVITDYEESGDLI